MRKTGTVDAAQCEQTQRILDESKEGECKMKKRLCIIILLTAVILTSLSMSTKAMSVFKESEEKKHITTVLERYLKVTEQKCDTVQISNPYRIYGNDDPNLKMYLVVSQESCIGRLLITQTNSGDLISSYYRENSSQLDRLIRERKPIAFFIERDQLFVQNGTSNIAVEATVNENKISEEKALNQISPTLEKVFGINVISSGKGIGLQVNLPVSIVANNSVDGKGLCWAASSAMVANYRKGLNYSALGVYNYLNNTYSGTPEGNNPWYERFFTHTNLQYNETGRMNSSALYNILQSNKPIIFTLKKQAFSFTLHDIVLRGLEFDDDGSVLYSFADPNSTSGYLYVIPNNTNGGSFPIVTNTGTYHIWLVSRY